MKKLTIIVLSFIFITFQAVKADVSVGITGAIHMFDATGTETTRQSGQKNSGSHSEDTLVPELLGNYWWSWLHSGLAYIPTRSVGSKSRSDTNSEGDTGTYKAEAELDNLVQIYVDVPITEAYGGTVYGKIGVQNATIATLESLNSGSTYPNQDVLGYTLGLGIRGDLPYDERMFYKADLTYTDFEDYSADSNSSPANRVEAELEDIALKFSVGYRF